MSPGASAGRLTDAHNTQLRLALNIFDAACSVILHRQQEKGLVFSLNQRILQLNSLIDTGIEVAKLSAELSPHHMALERAAALTNASGACVTLTRGDSPLEQFFFPAGFQVPTASTTPGIHAEFTFGEATYTFELFGKESRNGHASFDGTDQLLLDALARQVHASLENRFLLQQSLEKQRIEQDITVAASIQQRLLPASLPDIPGYDAAGINIPSKSVGGDYYDCIPLPDRKYALVIADVAGKGVPAALLVSSLHAYLSAYLEGSLSLVDLTRRLNTAIHRASTDDKFITAFLGILDPETGVLEAVNAGHCTVYLRRADATILELSQGGIPFGMLGIDFPYQSETVTLAPGDRLFLYTDGITEAQDEQNRLYDRDGNLKTYFATHTPCDAQTFVSALISDVRAFMGSTPQADDITALYLMRNT
jgi:serine phosphatase RsbU (regulator of sigma subunit)